MSDLDEVAKGLGQAFFIATVDAEGKPRVRPFGLAVPFQGHLWFVTSSEKKIFKELERNPFTEISAFDGAKGEWWRVHGRVHVAHELALKKTIFETAPAMDKLYKGPEDPILKTFWVEGAADLYSFASGPNQGPVRSVPLT
jgi:uncharacterized pyridoxamine 5'-phosphate oxidase family protein